MTGDDPFATHGAQVDAVLPTGDPAAIKQLYRDLGDLLAASVAGGGAVPVLSLPETLPVVTGLLHHVGGRLLDAGCGPNPIAALALAREDDRRFVVALDIGLGTVRLAVGVASQLGTRLPGVVADVEALPFRGGAFDGGVCDDTIEHLPDDATGAAELARVLRADGRMVIATPNRRSLEVVARKVRDRVRGRRRAPSHYYAASSHLREYTWPELERLIASRFTIRERATAGWTGGWRKSLASSLTRLPPLRRLSRMVVVVVSPRTGPATPR